MWDLHNPLKNYARNYSCLDTKTQRVLILCVLASFQEIIFRILPEMDSYNLLED
jgi:energy-converting hydrogenase A subunit M